MFKLYGDGVNDDTMAIQALLDSRISVVELKVPKSFYLISKPLKIYSNQTLKLYDTTTIKLMPNSNCYMLTNAEENAHDIVVEGGIWDYNNKFQAPNPIKMGKYNENGSSHLAGDKNTVVTYSDSYRGSVIHFYTVTRLSIRNLTVKDPVTYCVEMAYIKYFTVENVKFDQNLGNPTAENMDGIHIDGGCRFGLIKNVQGTCYDDIVALNADDGCDGPIEDIQIDGVFGSDSLRGVRLLSLKSKVDRISISNVFGTFYQNAIGLTYFYKRTGNRGKIGNVSIRNVFGKNAPRIPEYCKGDNSNFPFAFLWVDGDLDIDFLTVDNLCRNEDISNVETIKVCKNAHIKNFSISNFNHQNSTDKPITAIKNEGKIDKIYLVNVNSNGDKLIEDNGEIEVIKQV